MTAVGIIPARYRASRFPGKALTPIAGIAMIRRVWEGARRAKHLRTAIVATDDDRIASVCRDFGAEVAMTSPDHRTGTDRLAEVAADLRDEIVVNIQGDEPLIDGWVIDTAIEALREDPKPSMSTVVHRAGPENIDDPNRIKVVLDRRSDALYFSRSPIPAQSDLEAPTRYWQHVGLYAYWRSFLLEFAGLEQAPAERAEQLEQLRALENGHRIRCAVIEGWRSISSRCPRRCRAGGIGAARERGMLTATVRIIAVVLCRAG
jgi:3-deoxy-manno-octulosonate cytidylyltransferase (CMP-KDO synthetase)